MVGDAEPVSGQQHPRIPGNVVGQHVAGPGRGDEALGVGAAVVAPLLAPGVLAAGAAGTVPASADGADADPLSNPRGADARTDPGNDAGGLVSGVAGFHAFTPVGFQLAPAQGRDPGVDEHLAGARFRVGGVDADDLLVTEET